MAVDGVDGRRHVDRCLRCSALAGFLLALAWPSTSPAQGGSAAGTPLFGAAEPLTLRLEAPWKELTRRLEAGRTRQGRLVHRTAGGREVTLGVSVETRGKSRLEVCDWPMLTLELEAEEAAGTVFEGNPRVHLTTLCRNVRAYREYLINEYLLYRAYALLTEVALETRLVSIEYAEPESGKRPKAVMAFLLEDIAYAASRLGRHWLQPPSIRPAALDGDAAALLSLFQFMIANTDWSLLRGPEGEPCCHNTALLGASQSLEALSPLPFDLDTAGLIDAEYFAPSPALGIRSSRQRVYRGFCALNEHLPSAVERLSSRRAEILALFEGADGLAAGTKKRNVRYLEEFFEILGDPERFEGQVLADCR